MCGKTFAGCEPVGEGMKRYLYNYQTLVDFSCPVTQHAILLRCIPMPHAQVSVVERHVILSSGFWTQLQKDSFGNWVRYGGQRDAHRSLAYVSVGVVSVGEYRQEAMGIPHEAFLLPTPVTTLVKTPEMAALVMTGKAEEDAMTLCTFVHDMLTYTPACTHVGTTVAEIMATRKGVCQDYAHLMIALCRQYGIAARYACGFMEGVGETHAWVEVFDGYGWIGFDPTHNRRISYGYLKLAHGRDAIDCPVSRGTYCGGAAEQSQFIVTLKEI